jgi:outer membrane protein OmpA-like peptidoglycan-associated protein
MYRAEAVRLALTELGVAPERIRIQSRGERDARGDGARTRTTTSVDGRDETSRRPRRPVPPAPEPLDRRVEIEVEHGRQSVDGRRERSEVTSGENAAIPSF